MAIGDQGTPIKKSFSASASWTPGTVNDNATTSGTFTGITTSGYLLSCSVTGANSVTVMLLNKTGSQQTLGAGTLRVTVFQY